MSSVDENGWNGDSRDDADTHNTDLRDRQLLRSKASAISGVEPCTARTR